MDVLAPIGLILSIIFFIVSTYSANRSTEKLVDNLLQIEQSLSTKYVGIFPNYLPQINELLEDAQKNDTIIIFEDVLHYGIFSSPDEFKEMTYKLLDLSKTNKITIVYYNIDSSQNRIFRRSIQESRIKMQYLGKLSKERAELMRELRRNNNNTEGQSQNNFRIADSIVSEKYFAYSKIEPDFEKKVEKYLTPLFNPEKDADSLFFYIDEIKRKYIGKPAKTITFSDFYNLYEGIDKMLIAALDRNGVELIGVNEFHVMNCWKVGNKAILAFPSKYATNEIGFITQDPVFSDYILTMLKGVKEWIQ